MVNPETISGSKVVALRTEIFGQGDPGRYREAVMEYHAALGTVEDLKDLRNTHSDYDAALMLAQSRAVEKARGVKRDALVMALSIGQTIGIGKKEVISELEKIQN